jgi:colanic acid biosynthesis glycosyl transferase WcaI
MTVRTRRIPWILWLHDLLPDGAAATGLIDQGGKIVALARRLERTAYRTADRIVVLSRSFTDNLAMKGVDAEKLELIYDPATRTPRGTSERGWAEDGFRILSMGNIGHTQGLPQLIRIFEAHRDLTEGVSIRITGTGVAAESARAEIRTNRVQMLGLVDDERLEQELSEADVGLVTQRYDGPEFNIPSKLMNFMAYGLPILAVVDPGGEVARIVREAKAGWIVDSRELEALPQMVARITRERVELARCANNARSYASAHFTPAQFIARFEEVLLSVAGKG